MSHFKIQYVNNQFHLKAIFAFDFGIKFVSLSASQTLKKY